MNSLTRNRWRLLLLLTALAAGCDFPGQPKLSDRPVPADQVVNFDALYSLRCAGCHGADGKLGPAPPLNDPIFLAIVPDAELLRVITEGRTVTPTQKSPMPAFVQEKGGPLTDAQVKVLAEGIKKRWGPPPSPGESVPPYLLPAGVHAEKTDEGIRVFARACAGCHGIEGRGGKSGDRSVGAINDPTFLALISDQALRRYAITGRPDLGMPSYHGKDGRSEKFAPLTSAEIDALVALLAHWRQSGAANGN